ncbi:MAG: Wzy polymerase domain-containing protein [bacterium]
MPFADSVRVAPLAVALPFLFPLSSAPLPAFWQLGLSWMCVALLVAYACWRRASIQLWARRLAWGLLLAALLSACIGLLQYFGLGEALAPWGWPAEAGQAQGNLRQRNQQASLLNLGCWAALWLWSVRPDQPGARHHVSLGAALALLAVGSAATASRTGALQWLLVLALLALWRRGTQGSTLAWGSLAALVYALAAAVLPWLLQGTQGVHSLGVFERMVQEPAGCESRSVLWANVLELIAQRPWTGWGWGELDYAHYITLFEGTRFCAMLDNAHHLPLQLAVELGLPLALLLCGGVLAWLWRARPWREDLPHRRLAWGVLALLGVHSLLEYPLWYGPFQLVTLYAVWLLVPAEVPRVPARWVTGTLGLVLALSGYLLWDYQRVRQLYLAPQARDPAWLALLPARDAYHGVFLREFDFAILSTTPLTPDQAQRLNVLARSLLHYSPEPIVIETLIGSACLLGRADEAAYHEIRYRAAYAQEHTRWRQQQTHCPDVMQRAAGPAPERTGSRPDTPRIP